MSITTYKDDIRRDWDILKPNVYIENAKDLGCGTVWFDTVPEARKVLFSKDWDGPKGQDAGVCYLCACSYSLHDPEHKGKRDFLCRQYKYLWTQIAREL